MLRPLLVLLAPALLVAPAHAATFFVDASGTAPFVEIQPAMDAAAEGDVVVVAAGTYGPIDFDGKGITVRSTGGPAVTTIDAAGVGSAVAFGAAAPDATLLHGFTITGGVGTWVDTIGSVAGGGILVERESSPRISGNVIEGNAASVGAGIAVINATPAIYGNTVSGNTASASAGGLWVRNAASPGLVLVACNAFLGNEGAGVGGVFADAVELAFHNNQLNGNAGERGGLWAEVDAVGLVANNTFVANESAFGAAAGVESQAAGLDFAGNLIAHGQIGWGVVRGSADASWTFNDLWANDAGAWAGLGEPDLADGNLALEPLFVSFSIANPANDDLRLQPSALRDAGPPGPAFFDLDGSRNSVGFEGGPHEGCDLDGDGVRADEGDCQPGSALFFPGSLENQWGLDQDCSGFANVEVFDFVASDGGAVADGFWEFGDPSDLPGHGYRSNQAWCTGCGSTPARPDEGALEFELDLTRFVPDTELRLRLVLAWDADPGFDGLIAQRFDGLEWTQIESINGYPGVLPDDTDNPLTGLAPLGTWADVPRGWVADSLDLTADAGAVASIRLLAGTGSGGSGAGWALGELAVQVVDGDGDGYGSQSTDCDDTDPTAHDGAAEIPYDGVDQDCDGADLADVDGDGFEGPTADCDDEDPGTHPDAEDLPYDGIDQDCDGFDLIDVDGDGWDGPTADCDDGDAAIHPFADEVPYDGVDQDCDGLDLIDVDGDGFAGDADDCDDEDPLVHPGRPELCDDGIDQDCDGTVDLAGDDDGDGFDVCGGDCDDDRAAVHPGADELCDGLDGDCDSVLPAQELDVDADGSRRCDGDCDDDDAARAPGLPEVCDGVDNDCVRGVDDGHDLDFDGFSGCTSDCDDRRSTVYPGADPVCDSNRDHDCDGVLDFEQEDCQPTTGCSVGGRPSGLAWLLLAFVRRRFSGPSGPSPRR